MRRRDAGARGIAAGFAGRVGGMRMRRVGRLPVVAGVGALVLSLLGGGCQSPIPVVRDDAELQALQKRTSAAPAPVRVKLAVAPVELAYAPTADLEKDSTRYPATVDGEELRKELCEALEAYAGLPRPTPVNAPRLEDAFRPAEAAGAEVLLRPVFTKLDCVWVGHTGSWVPNIALFLYAWVPSFWVADEEYGMQGEMELRYYNVASERLIHEKRVPIDLKWQLDDFERGWSWTGIITAPSSVSANDWGEVSKSLARHLRFHAAKAAALDAGTGLPEALAPSGGEAAKVRKVRELEATAYAFLCGISRHGGGVSGGARGAAKDVQALRALLTSAVGVPEKNVTVLEDNEATVPNVEASLRTICERTRPGDALLVYWSGMGAAIGDGPALTRYLVPFDVDGRAPERTCIPLTRLFEIIAGAQARRVIVMLDASFGGRRPGSRSLLRADGAPLLADESALVELTRAGGGKDVSLVVAAAPGEDAVDLDGSERGLFSFLVEEAVSGRADEDRSGVVTVRELTSFLEREVPAQAGLDGVDAHPRHYRAGARVEAGAAGANDPWLPAVAKGGGVK